MDKFILVSILLVLSIECFGLKCLVCTRGEGEEDLCAPDEDGEEVECPETWKYCKRIWTELSGMDRKYYKGCLQKLSKGKEKLTFIPGYSVACRIEVLENGVKQECFCKSESCNQEEVHDLPRLKCLFCKDSNNDSSVSPCPHGAETEARECTVRLAPACTTIISKESGERISLGCEKHYYLTLYPQCHEFAANHPHNPGVVDVYACQCNTDSCNMYTEKVKDFRTCHACIRGGHEPESLNKCTDDESTGREILCSPGWKYCFSTFSSLPGDRYDERRYTGCAKELPAEDGKFSKFPVVKWPTPDACRFQVENDVINQECHCSTDSCNVAIEDIPGFKICYVCGGNDNLCAAGEEGEAQLCPNDMKYCYYSWTWSGRPGEERKYYKGCAEQLPTQEHKFTKVDSTDNLRPRSSLCRIVTLGKDDVRQECFCSPSACNRKRDYLYDLRSFRCILCKGEDNLCAPGEEGEVGLCSRHMAYCKNNWREQPGEGRKYYIGCAELPPAGNDVFTVKDSVSCRIEQPDKGFINQECYCTPDNCNRNSFADLPIPDPSLKCKVCEWGVGNFCPDGEEGGYDTRCPKDAKYCENRWREHTGIGKRRDYYKGCVNELPAGEDKFIVKGLTYCRLLPGQGSKEQQCYCKSDLCNARFDDLQDPNPEKEEHDHGHDLETDSGGFDFKCIHPNGGVNTFPAVIIVPVVLLHIILI